MTVTKKNLSKTISLKTKIPNIKAQIFLESLISIIKRESKTKVIKIHNFGSFSYRNTLERVGRNPKTGKEYIIKPMHKIFFKASSLIKNILN